MVMLRRGDNALAFAMRWFDDSNFFCAEDAREGFY